MDVSCIDISRFCYPRITLVIQLLKFHFQQIQRWEKTEKQNQKKNWEEIKRAWQEFPCEVPIYFVFALVG